MIIAVRNHNIEGIKNISEIWEGAFINIPGPKEESAAHSAVEMAEAENHESLTRFFEIINAPKECGASG